MASDLGGAIAEAAAARILILLIVVICLAVGGTLGVEWLWHHVHISIFAS